MVNKELFVRGSVELYVEVGSAGLRAGGEKRGDPEVSLSGTTEGTDDLVVGRARVVDDELLGGDLGDTLLLGLRVSRLGEIAVAWSTGHNTDPSDRASEGGRGVGKWDRLGG